MQPRQIPTEKQLETLQQLKSQFEAQLRKVRYYLNIADLKTIDEAINTSNLSKEAKDYLKSTYFNPNEIGNLSIRNLNGAIECLQDTIEREERAGKHFAIQLDYDDLGLRSHTVYVSGDIKGKLTSSSVNEIEINGDNGEKVKTYNKVKWVFIKECNSKKDADAFCKKSNYISYLMIAAATLSAGASIGFFCWLISEMETHKLERKFKILKNMLDNDQQLSAEIAEGFKINKMLGNDEQLSAEIVEALKINNKINKMLGNDEQLLSAESFEKLKKEFVEKLKKEFVEALNKELTSIEKTIKSATSDFKLAGYGFVISVVVLLLVVFIIDERLHKNSNFNSNYDLTTQTGRDKFNEDFKDKGFQTLGKENLNETQAKEDGESEIEKKGCETFNEDFKRKGLNETQGNKTELQPGQSNLNTKYIPVGFEDEDLSVDFFNNQLHKELQKKNINITKFQSKKQYTR